jgi:hypothetical protein
LWTDSHNAWCTFSQQPCRTKRCGTSDEQIAFIRVERGNQKNQILRGMELMFATLSSGGLEECAQLQLHVIVTVTNQKLFDRGDGHSAVRFASAEWIDV